MIWKMTGFDDADFFQTEQTGNRKKSGFRAAPEFLIKIFWEFETVPKRQDKWLPASSTHIFKNCLFCSIQ